MALSNQFIAGLKKQQLRRSTMLKKAFSVFSLALAGLLLTPLAVAQTVTGEVTDANNTVVFAGAEINITELQRSTTSDDRGKFRFSNIPAGEYTLVVSYVGAADRSMPITVGADGLAIGSIAIGASGEAAEEVIVYGQAAALAGALSQERSAENLVSVLDTDAMGQFPDQNVAESLRRLSGVTVENDQGEGRYVVIRGMDPDLNATSINGMRASAAEPRRAMQLDVIPSDVLDGLEIHKTLTADMDGDSIGGSINIKTLSAFSRKGAYIKARAEASQNGLSEEWGPKLSIAGSNIFELNNGRRLGVAGALSYHERTLQIDNNEMDDWEVADNGNDFAEEFQPRLYQVGRERIGGVLNFDLDISDSTRLYAYTLYSEFTDTELRNRVSMGLDGLDEDTVTATRADYSVVEVERDTKGRDRQGQVAETLSISLGSETQLQNWLVETHIGYAYGRERTLDQVSGTWVAEFESGDGNITDGMPVLSIDRSNPQLPVVDSDFGNFLTDASLFELDELEHFKETNEDTSNSLGLDLTRETGFGSIKFGAKMRWREKKTNETAEIYSGDGTWTLDQAVLPDGGAVYGFSTPIDPVPDNSIERDILASGVGIDFEDLDSDIDSNVADFVFDEDVLAAYAMATWDGDRSSFTLGVRVEQTDLDNRGNFVEIVEEDQNGPADPPQDEVNVSPIAATNSYTDVLPSANIRFEFSERVVARASIFRSVVRPRVEEMAFRVELEDGEAVLGNPDLDPFRAWNLDASIAFYPTELSVVSVGAFYKEIEDFIFVQIIDDFEYLGMTLDEAEIALNGDTATVLGLEFNYQQHFGFLSPPFDGLILGFNYTYVDSEANTGEREVTLPKQAANIANAMLGYEKGGFDIRFAMKYRDTYIDELVDPDYDRYVAEHTQWDVTAKYRFSDSWLVYAEISNLGDQPEHYYSGNKNRLYQYDEFGTFSAIGFQYNFNE